MPEMLRLAGMCCGGGGEGGTHSPRQLAGVMHLVNLLYTVGPNV